VAAILAQDSSLANEDGLLMEAVRAGHEKVVAQLLRHIRPATVINSFLSVVGGGFSTMIMPFLDHDPTLADLNNASGEPVIITAARFGWEKVIDRMLSFKPALARAVSSPFGTLLLGGTRDDGDDAEGSFYSPELSKRET